MQTIQNTPPDITGAARAWKIDKEPAREKALAEGKSGGTEVAGYIVNAPWSHPIWPNVAVVGIHLRDMPGQTHPPHIHLQGATHEIIVLALSPDWIPEIAPERLVFLTPTNFTGQFKADSDEAAAEVIEKIVRRICAGQLNPDTDGSSQWVAIFGDHCFREEYKRGVMGSLNEGVPL